MHLTYLFVLISDHKRTYMWTSCASSVSSSVSKPSGALRTWVG